MHRGSSPSVLIGVDSQRGSKRREWGLEWSFDSSSSVVSPVVSASMRSG